MILIYYLQSISCTHYKYVDINILYVVYLYPMVISQNRMLETLKIMSIGIDSSSIEIGHQCVDSIRFPFLFEYV